MAAHEILRKCLARFETRGRPCGSDNSQAAAFEHINEAFRQWRFRPDHREIDSRRLCEPRQALAIVGFDSYALCNLSNAGIAGRAKKFRRVGRRVLQRPTDRMLSPPRSNHQNFHRLFYSSSIELMQAISLR